MGAHGEVHPVENAALIAGRCTCDEWAAADTARAIGGGLAYANIWVTTFPYTPITRQARCVRTDIQTLAARGVEGLPLLAVRDAVAAAWRGATRAATLAHAVHAL